MCPNCDFIKQQNLDLQLLPERRTAWSERGIRVSRKMSVTEPRCQSCAVGSEQVERGEYLLVRNFPSRFGAGGFVCTLAAVIGWVRVLPRAVR